MSRDPEIPAQLRVPNPPVPNTQKIPNNLENYPKKYSKYLQKILKIPESNTPNLRPKEVTKKIIRQQFFNNYKDAVYQFAMACIISDKIMLKSTKSTKKCNIL